MSVAIGWVRWLWWGWQQVRCVAWCFVLAPLIEDLFFLVVSKSCMQERALLEILH
jgi:hypothetical protein